MADVFIATPMFGGQCSGGYAVSLAKLVATFINSGVALRFGYVMGESLVTRARDALVADFLDTPCTHLMFIDADIEFSPVDILAMVDAGKDIICGLYPRKEIDWYAVRAAVIEEDASATDLCKYTGNLVVNTIPGQPSVQVGGRNPVEVVNAGTGFMLVRREVLEEIGPSLPVYRNKDGRQVTQFFDTEIVDGTLLSEDFYFCKTAGFYGFKTWAAPWVKLARHGSYVYGGRQE